MKKTSVLRWVTPQSHFAGVILDSAKRRGAEIGAKLVHSHVAELSDGPQAGAIEVVVVFEHSRRHSSFVNSICGTAETDKMHSAAEIVENQ